MKNNYTHLLLLIQLHTHVYIHTGITVHTHLQTIKQLWNMGRGKTNLDRIIFLIEIIN